MLFVVSYDRRVVGCVRYFLRYQDKTFHSVEEPTTPVRAKFRYMNDILVDAANAISALGPR